MGLRAVYGKRFGFALAMLVALLMALLLAGCGSDVQKAAEFGDTVITEDEVSDYTARFRERGGYEDDSSWKAYLTARGIGVKEWRESAIRTLATEQLVRDRAAELGIEPKEDDVESAIASTKSLYGVEQGDEEAWAEALAAIGTTPEEYRGNCEYASLQQQLVLLEKADEIEASGDAIQDYMSANLADRVVRRFEVLSFAKDDKDAAQDTFDELSSLEGEQLAKRFAEIEESRAESGDGTLFNGNLGWDAMYGTESVMDPDVKINVMEGQLYPELVDAGGQWQIYWCAERFIFTPDVTYDTIESESLRECIKELAISSNLKSIAEDYLTDLVDQACVQVYPMPEGLPYGVE